MDQQTPDRIIRLDEVLARVSLSKPSLFRLVKQGKFPAPKRLSARAIGWIERSVDDWLASLPSSTEVSGDIGVSAERLTAARRQKRSQKKRSARH